MTIPRIYKCIKLLVKIHIKSYEEIFHGREISNRMDNSKVTFTYTHTIN